MLKKGYLARRKACKALTQFVRTLGEGIKLFTLIFHLGSSLCFGGMV